MMNSDIHFHAFRTKEELVEQLSRDIAMDLQNAIEIKGYASLIVSGGSTPKPLFEKLRKSKIAWDKVRVGLCDERWVPIDHKDSNAGLVRDYLLRDEAKEATFFGMFSDGVEAQVAQEKCSETIKEQLYPFDVLILGMGGDAHTASLFPENPKLDEGFDMDNPSLCIAIKPTDAPHMRMSLTLQAILSAKNLYLHFEGETKLAVYEEALKGKERHKMPIRSILQQEEKKVEVYYA